MKVEAVNWLDEDASEASVTISDGTFHCNAYCQPCNFVPGQSIAGLVALNVKICVASEGGRYHVESRGGQSYALTAAVEDRDRDLVRLGGLTIEVGPCLPGDARNGDMLDLVVSRLDCY